ncbi:MAG TPA: hypothetical protein VIU61_01650 [Kofleriaceae bacterium]
MAVLIVLLAAPASADVGPPPATGCGGCTPARAGDPDTGGTLTRGQFLTIGSIVIAGFGAADVVETVRTGRPNFSVVGVQLIASLPVVIYGIDFVRSDTSDWASWGVTLGATALVGVTAWRWFEYLTGRTEEDRTAIRARPSVLVGWDDVQPRSGLVVTGGF